MPLIIAEISIESHALCYYNDSMNIEDEILLEAVSDEEEYDRAVKALFLNPRILAPIIKMAISEFADVPIDDIIDSIKDISDIDAVDDVSAVASKKSMKLEVEQTSVSEKLIVYDVHFKIINPALSSEEILVYLYVDIEVQGDSHESSLGYPLLKRAMYYVARELSGQLGILTNETDYNKLQKCYSIWICDGVPKDQQNTMTRYHMTKEDLIGVSCDASEAYDLMEVVMIRRGDDKITDGILDYLAGLFSHNIDRMDRYSHIKGDNETVEEVRRMGGFGKALVEKTREAALNEGRKEGKEEGIKEGKKEGIKEGKEEGIKEGIKEGAKGAQENILNNIIKNLMKANDMLTKEQATEQAKALMA